MEIVSHANARKEASNIQNEGGGTGEEAQLEVVRETPFLGDN